MTILFDDLVALITKHCSWRDNDLPPHEALYIQFYKPGEKMVAQDTLTMNATDNSAIAIDITKENEVFGIEII